MDGRGLARGALAAVVALTCGVALASAARTDARTAAVSVQVREWEFTLSPESAPAGPVVFSVANTGDEPHDFSIGGKTTGRLQGHQSATLTVTFSEPGTYAYTSALDDLDRDMYGYFKVTGAAQTTSAATTTAATTTNAQRLPLRTVADVPLTGGTSRFDYQSFDASSHRLWIAHLGADSVISFDVRRQRVAATVRGVPGAHGVLAVPQLRSVFATATDSHELVRIGAGARVASRVRAGAFPDGLAYAPKQKEIYVSDKTGDAVVVLGALGAARAKIDLGGEAGNVKFDQRSSRMLVAVAGREQLVAIDPRTRRVRARYALRGCDGAHGAQVDGPHRLAFVACEGNAKLFVVDLKRKRATASYGVGSSPDVLALDGALGRLYVAAESGTVSVFAVRGRVLRKLGEATVASSAHSVAVDPATHRVYFPLEDVGGKPVLRIMTPG
jgi:DNA-binding beta-propeller fold protein YncE/plastocyanin